MRKELFDDAIGAVPPSTVDVDGVVTRGRRAVRVRQVANPAVVAGIAVMVLGGVLAATVDDGAPGGVGAGTQPGSSVVLTAPGGEPVNPSDKQPPPACATADLETPAELNVRLTGVAAEAVAALRPDVTLSAFPRSTIGALEFQQATDDNQEKGICEFRTTAVAEATVTGPEGIGNLTIMVEPHWSDKAEYGPDTGLGPCAGGACEKSALPGGGEVRWEIAASGGAVIHRVEVLRPDGTWVLASAENVPVSVKSDDTPTAPAPPFTLEQLRAIAENPAFTLFR